MTGANNFIFKELTPVRSDINCVLLQKCKFRRGFKEQVQRLSPQNLPPKVKIPFLTDMFHFKKTKTQVLSFESSTPVLAFQANNLFATWKKLQFLKDIDFSFNSFSLNSCLTCTL